MKRHVTLLAAAAIAVSLLAGCGPTPRDVSQNNTTAPANTGAAPSNPGGTGSSVPAATPSPKAVTEGPLPFTAKYIRGGWSTDTKYPAATLIRSKTQLDAYCSACDPDTEFYKEASGYGEAYFKENALIDVLLQEGSGSNRHKVAGLLTTQEGLEITVARLVPIGGGTDDMAEWHVLVETGKAGLPDGEISVALYAAAMPYKADYSKLWAVDLSRQGLARSGASRAISWQGADTRMALSIGPLEYAQKPPEGAETVSLHGKEYRVYEQSYFVDGPDFGGKVRQKGVVWESGGFGYRFYAEAGKDESSLEAVSPETAERLEATPPVRFEGFDIISDAWRAEFAKESIVVNVSATPFDYAVNTIHRDIKKDGYKLVSEDGISYYVVKRTDSGRTASVSMLWRTDIGLFSLSAGISPTYLGEVPKDALDFIGIGLAKSITEQMGGKIVPFE